VSIDSAGVDGVQREIVRVHDFFSAWSEGDEERTLSEIEDCLDEHFYLVSPDGEVRAKTETVGYIAEMRNRAPLKLTIRNVRIKHVVVDLLVAVYEEHQSTAAGERVYVSTVGMMPDGRAPGGYRWLFVHEAQLPRSA